MNIFKRYVHYFSRQKVANCYILNSFFMKELKYNPLFKPNLSPQKKHYIRQF